MKSFKSIFFQKVSLLVVVSLASVSVVGCGRYAPPLPPELTSPSAVEYTQVSSTPDSVSMQWLAPVTQVRGNPLRSLAGYRIYRRDVPAYRILGEELEVPEYELRAVVWDDTVERREIKERELRSELKPTRQAKLSEAERTVSYTDQIPRANIHYLYKILPFNTVGHEGPAKKFVEVISNGKESIARQIASEKDAGKLGNDAKLALEPQTDPMAELNAEAAAQQPTTGVTSPLS